MMCIKLISNFRNPQYFSIILFFVMNSFFAQSIQQEKMQKLSYIVGEWIGTSTSFKNDTIVKQVAAFENVHYKLDKSIITIDLHSESLQLHTVIYYDEKNKKYCYQPYYKTGVGNYYGEYADGKFTVWFNEKRRLIFQLTPEGHFQEYGEKLEKGQWHKYFEDILKKAH